MQQVQMPQVGSCVPLGRCLRSLCETVPLPHDSRTPWASQRSITASGASGTATRSSSDSTSPTDGRYPAMASTDRPGISRATSKFRDQVRFLLLLLLFLHSIHLLLSSSAPLSQLHAGAGWTGMSAVSNGGMVEPGQGVNGTMLTNQTGMSTAGYPTHWSHTAVSEPEARRKKLCWGKERIRCALCYHTCYSVRGAGAPCYQLYWLITLSTAQICKCEGKLPQNTWTLSKQPKQLIHLAFPGSFSIFGTLL